MMTQLIRGLPVLVATSVLASCIADDAPQPVIPTLIMDGTALVTNHVPAPFIDQAAQDPSFVTYRAELIAAITAKDATAVAEMAATEIKLSFGDEGGRQMFFDKLTDASDAVLPPKGDAYWQELAAVVTAGGQFDQSGTFTAPYSWGISIPPEWNSFETYVVNSDPRPVFAEPSQDAPILMTIRDAAVEVQPYDGPFVIPTADGLPLFYPLKLVDGRTGFVRRADLRNYVDYRAYFDKWDGKWQMTIFLAGD